MTSALNVVLRAVVMRSKEEEQKSQQETINRMLALKHLL